VAYEAARGRHAGALLYLLGEAVGRT
jgi:hypothetical protein